MPSAREQPLVHPAEFRRLYEQVAELQLPQRRRSASPYAGSVLSLFRGHGMELEDSRPYQHGDDPRYIDWRATARSGKPMSKIFVEERQHDLFLIIDRGPSMRFGTRRQLKAAAAIRAAAVFAFTALRLHQRVGGLVVSEDGMRPFSARRDLDSALQLLTAAATPVGVAQGTAQSPAFDAIAETATRAAGAGATLCWLSDFRTLADVHVPQLLRLAYRHDPLAVVVEDPGEQEIPNVGRLRVRAPGSGRIYTVDTATPELRRRFAATAIEERQIRERLFMRAGFGYLSLSTAADTWTQLAHLH